MKSSITRRISAWFAALSSVALLALGGYLYWALDEHFSQQDTAELLGKVKLIRHILSEIRSEAELSANTGRFEDALVGNEKLHLSLRGSDGQDLFASRHVQIPDRAWGETAGVQDLPEGSMMWSPAPDSRYRVVSAWGQIGERSLERVRIILARDVSDHDEILRRYRQSLIAALGAGLIAVTLLGWWIARRELDPVRRMARTAQRTSASRLGERLDLSQTPVELRQLGEAFNSMLARLEGSFARLSDFSSDLAHELRTPIHNLMVQSQVVLDKTRSAGEYRQALEANVEELDRVARMVEDMLFLAKTDNAQALLRKETVDIREEVDKVSSYFEALASERGVKIACEGSAKVRADRSLADRVISNYLSNAIRYSVPGSTVLVSIARVDSGVQIDVTNAGPGIPPEHQTRVFDRFFQVNPSRPHGDTGSGLGLAIVKSIMDLHDGAVSVASSPQGPTTFTAWFPS